MNKIMYVCLFVLGTIVYGLIGYAAESWQDNPAVQVYRDADDAPVASTDTAMPEPASGVVVPPSASVTPSPSAPDLASAQTPERAALVDSQITQLNTKIEALSADAVMMQAQIKQLTHALLLLNRKISTPTVVKPASSLYEQWFYPAIAIISLVLVIGFSIGIALWLIKRAKRRVNKTTASDSDAMADGPEYDYMGSQESVPVKLNLARAYIAMEDFKAAKKVIADVLAVGNEAQREEAQRLDASITVDE